MADPVRPQTGDKRRMIIRSSAGRSPAGSSETDTQPDRSAKLGPDLQAHIGRQLRSMYDEVLKEPVPDRLRDLLQQLEQKPRGQS